MERVRTADVVVIGGNPGGCAAAIAAARSGRTVILLEPTSTLGGMCANGVCGFDTASPKALSGLAKEVEARVRDHYRTALPGDPLLKRRSDQVWEPRVAAAVWTDLVAEEPNVAVLLGATPVGVSTANGRITEVTWRPATDPMGNVSDGDGDDTTVVGRIVIDASYEGDVTAWSGTPFYLGREARSHDEPHAGVIFTNNLEAAPPGFLPGSILPGSTGEADDALMGFSFRMICRRYDRSDADAPHRIKSPPAGYRSGDFRWMPMGTAPDGTAVFFNSLYVVAGGKLLLNRMAFGNNLAGPARAYVLAGPVEREALRQRFIDHSLGFLFFVQNEGGMPELGLADDEFQDNGFFPRQLYVREGRRAEGRELLTEADINPFIRGDGVRPPFKPNAVAVADWMLESVSCSDEARPGYPYPEGFVFARVTQAPFQIPYGCLLPEGVDNLLCPGPLSATHVAFSAVRCEGARVQTGIAAGVAAALAVERGIDPRDVPVGAIQDELVRRGGQLTFLSDIDESHPDFMFVQWAALRGFVPADRTCSFFPDRPGTWADLAEASVRCFGLPISVTGAHFDRVRPDHPSFRWFESLYDLGTRAGVDIFDMRAVWEEDPMRDFIRIDRTPKLIPVRAEAHVTARDADALIARVVEAATGLTPAVRARAPAEMPLTRGVLCRRLWAAGRAMEGARSVGSEPAAERTGQAVNKGAIR